MMLVGNFPHKIYSLLGSIVILFLHLAFAFCCTIDKLPKLIAISFYVKYVVPNIKGCAVNFKIYTKSSCLSPCVYILTIEVPTMSTDWLLANLTVSRVLVSSERNLQDCGKELYSLSDIISMELPESMSAAT